MDKLVCVDDFHNEARKKMTKISYEYYWTGADENQTLERNVEAFKRLLIRPRFLVDVSKICTKVTLMGKFQLESPICIAPTSCHKLAHPDGELATARATADAKTLYVVSTAATTKLEDINEAAPDGLRWFQLYVQQDKAKTMELIRRAEEAGYQALVLTVDHPVMSHRRVDMRNDFRLPEPLCWANLVDESNVQSEMIEDIHTGRLTFKSFVDSSLDWSGLDWIKSVTKLPIVLKGIMTADDAILACEHGIQAIYVSNHGGRQLDSAPATIEVLPEIVKAVGQKCEIYIDGGVRTGNSVFKALALGARAVFVGRPVLYGLAVAGQKGVRKILDILNDELRTTMALAGCPNLNLIGQDRKVVHEKTFMNNL